MKKSESADIITDPGRIHSALRIIDARRNTHALASFFSACLAELYCRKKREQPTGMLKNPFFDWPTAWLVYFAVALALAPHHFLSLDTFYYWDWSRHLALSYYDGSPFIAYLIKAATLLFGNSLFALNIVGITTLALTTGILYKTGLLFLEKKASQIATSLWLFSPLTTLDILHQTTYDTPLILFWALTVFFSIRFIQSTEHYLNTPTCHDLSVASLDPSDKSRESEAQQVMLRKERPTPGNAGRTDFFFIALSAGLLLLSKYTGVILLLGIGLFICFSPYRYLLRSYYLYAALFIVLCFFSPVLIWNYHHHWQSFLYQLTTHQTTSNDHGLAHLLKTLLEVYLPAVNFLLAPLFLWALPKSSWSDHFFRSRKAQEGGARRAVLRPDDGNAGNAIYFCLIISLTLLGFYGVMSLQVTIRANWLSPVLLTNALLAAYCVQQGYWKKSVNIVIVLYALVSLIIISPLPDRFMPSKRMSYYQQIEQLNRDYPTLPPIVITTGWFEARPLFFLNNKPFIYTINCGSLENQYDEWSVDIKKKLLSRTLNDILYIDPVDRSGCLTPYFKRCEPLLLSTTQSLWQKYPLFAYRCRNVR